jgi:long-subunit acyl-CoA synthetase (AMP-forming)
MTSTIMSRAALSLAAAPEINNVRCLATDSELDCVETDWHERATSPTAIAFLQYTSGSTGKPKGVMLSHENLLHNASLVYNAVEHSSTDKYVSWLPTFHDMGFMGITTAVRRIPCHPDVAGIVFAATDQVATGYFPQ